MFMLIGLVRVWLLYYDTHITKLNLHGAWLSVIDSTIETENWFKKHEKTWGNARFLIKLSVGLVVLLTLIAVLLRLIGLRPVARILEWFFIFVVTVVTMVIWRKLKDYQYDSLGIRREMIALFICGIATFTIGVSMVVLHLFGIIVFPVYDACWTVNVSIGMSALGVITTLYTKKLSTMEDVTTPCDICASCKIKMRYCVLSYCKYKCGWLVAESALPSMDMSNVVTVSATDKSPSVKPETYSPPMHVTTFGRQNTGFGFSWRDIVCTPFGFESLMNHLSNEFSVENLLFISEVKCQLSQTTSI